jgi:hypothetical protein
MRGFFFNIRGVEHPDKQRFLREIIREEAVTALIGLKRFLGIGILPRRVHLQ